MKLASPQLSASRKYCGINIITDSNDPYNIHTTTSLDSSKENWDMTPLTLTLLLLLYSCSKIRCTKISPKTNNGSRKCKENIRPNVASLSVYPLQTLSRRILPSGNTDRRFVMTVAPHKDILPHGST